MDFNVEFPNNHIKLKFPVWDYIFDRLSNDPISHIFSFASFNELSSFSSVCKRWNNLIKPNNRLWADLCQSYWKNKTYVPSQYRNLLKG